MWGTCHARLARLLNFLVKRLTAWNPSKVLAVFRADLNSECQLISPQGHASSHITPKGMYVTPRAARHPDEAAALGLVQSVYHSGISVQPTLTHFPTTIKTRHRPARQDIRLAYLCLTLCMAIPKAKSTATVYRHTCPPLHNTYQTLLVYRLAAGPRTAAAARAGTLGSISRICFPDSVSFSRRVSASRWRSRSWSLRTPLALP